MSKRILTYNGIDLSTFGAHVSGEGAWVKPAPEFERISVPGRSGDVLLYNGRYSNVDVQYRFGITENFDANYTSLIAALLDSPGYHKLVDSKHPGVYRMAAVSKGIEPEMSQQMGAGEFNVIFDCKPQVYLDSGEEVASTWNSSSYRTSTVKNPTAYPARPLFKIYASGTGFTFRISYSDNYEIHVITFEIEEVTDISNISFPLYYDSEGGYVYDSNWKNLNNYVAVVKGYYITSHEYTDAIILGNEDIYASVPDSASRDIISKIEIIPRWWRL